MINVIWGSAKNKPESSKSLAQLLSADHDVNGNLYIGYPVVGSPTGPVKFDALLLSQQHGLVAFDLVEGLDVGEFAERQDEIAAMLDVKLKPYAGLKHGRELKFPVNVVTFAPVKKALADDEPPYYLANNATLLETVNGFAWPSDAETFSKLMAAIQVVTNIRAGKQKRELTNANSRGARLKKVEDSIANLDQRQSQAVIETVEGVQRVRGLAGSGKTIVLALKVAYLHSQNEDWRLAVTFNTRSLKEQFKRLINAFTIEQTGAEPDWEKIDILNAWGGPGDKEQDGIYHKFCREHSIPFLDFGMAKVKFGDGREFEGACANALAQVSVEHPFYDMILVDEAQDFPPEFLRLCYRFLREPKRLVYAYDELQSLTGNAVLPPEDLFGRDSQGEPLVRFNPDENAIPRQDIILEKCYRNSRPLLATAHALGFGIYRKKGLVQLFEQDNLWTEVGYTVVDGELQAGKKVTLARTPATSPPFLEDHSPPDDLIQFLKFESAAHQTAWLVEAIQKDLSVEELRPEDIVVINPNPLSTQREVGAARQQLFSLNINNELAGVSTSRDVFVKSGTVTFTGIFRAKGNEAGMVYIINAHDCFSSYSKAHLALIRNRLFTAITRSKAWVRVLGIGPGMDGLIEEWNELRSKDYKLSFTYPTEEEKLQLRLISKDLSPRQRTRQIRLREQAREVMEAMRRGEIDAEEFIQELESPKHRTSKK